MPTNSIEVKLAGATIGFASGWDELDDLTLLFYDVILAEEFKECFSYDGPADTLVIDYVEGRITIQEDDSNLEYIFKVTELTVETEAVVGEVAPAEPCEITIPAGETTP